MYTAPRFRSNPGTRGDANIVYIVYRPGEQPRYVGSRLAHTRTHAAHVSLNASRDQQELHLNTQTQTHKPTTQKRTRTTGQQGLLADYVTENTVFAE